MIDFHKTAAADVLVCCGIFSWPIRLVRIFFFYIRYILRESFFEDLRLMWEETTCAKTWGSFKYWGYELLLSHCNISHKIQNLWGIKFAPFHLFWIVYELHTSNVKISFMRADWFLLLSWNDKYTKPSYRKNPINKNIPIFTIKNNASTISYQRIWIRNLKSDWYDCARSRSTW